MRISDCGSDVCSSDLPFFALILAAEPGRQFTILIQRQEHRSWTAVMQDINRPVRASVLPDREVPHDFRGGHALLIALYRRGMGASHDKLLLVEALSCPAAQRSFSFGKQYRPAAPVRSEEHTSELQSLMRLLYSVLFL